MMLELCFTSELEAAVTKYEARVVGLDGTVTDGHFPESKQYLGGFAVVDVPDPTF
jgi:hypothetical protein